MGPYNFMTVTLKIEDQTSLAILMHKDGTINRKGDGSINIDRNMFMGVAKEPLFDRFIATLHPDLDQILGKSGEMPDQKGKKCSVEIALGDGKEGTGSLITYGSDLMGPPLPIVEFVNNAVRITDPWYREQQQVIRKREKKWWQFWK